MSAEAAALRLGTTVAKTAATSGWAAGGDSRSGTCRWRSWYGFGCPDLRLQRSVERQFGQITDAVFDWLEPYPEHEIRGLD
ncbi:hypothetical protein [Streptomyces sp. DG1A-41]|uniref:NACHT N-terminal Helical domain 1-containing protein n=1 Tax=Streptomyces sp. DG1A-41 TaxID=3125779 RepID=UPI0030D07FE3